MKFLVIISLIIASTTLTVSQSIPKQGESTLTKQSTKLHNVHYNGKRGLVALNHGSDSFPGHGPTVRFLNGPDSYPGAGSSVKYLHQPDPSLSHGPSVKYLNGPDSYPGAGSSVKYLHQPDASLSQGPPGKYLSDPDSFPTQFQPISVAGHGQFPTMSLHGALDASALTSYDTPSVYPQAAAHAAPLAYATSALAFPVELSGGKSLPILMAQALHGGNVGKLGPIQFEGSNGPVPPSIIKPQSHFGFTTAGLNLGLPSTTYGIPSHSTKVPLIPGHQMLSYLQHGLSSSNDFIAPASHSLKVLPVTSAISSGYSHGESAALYPGLQPEHKTVYPVSGLKSGFSSSGYAPASAYISPSPSHYPISAVKSASFPSAIKSSHSISSLKSGFSAAAYAPSSQSYKPVFSHKQVPDSYNQYSAHSIPNFKQLPINVSPELSHYPGVGSLTYEQPGKGLEFLTQSYSNGPLSSHGPLSESLKHQSLGSTSSLGSINHLGPASSYQQASFEISPYSQDTKFSHNYQPSHSLESQPAHSQHLDLGSPDLSDQKPGSSYSPRDPSSYETHIAASLGLEKGFSASFGTPIFPPNQNQKGHSFSDYQNSHSSLDSLPPSYEPHSNNLDFSYKSQGGDGNLSPPPPQSGGHSDYSGGSSSQDLSHYDSSNGLTGDYNPESSGSSLSNSYSAAPSNLGDASEYNTIAYSGHVEPIKDITSSNV